MAQLNIKIENLDKLGTAFKKSPEKVLVQIGKALTASVFEVKKNANDNQFRFKGRRSRRTGGLEQSFAYGIKVEKLKASIGPTVNYAIFVHEGTSRGIRPNRFMDRIAKVSEKDVEKHFQKAVDNVISDIIK